ncbi:MAG: alpha/beta hydrolase [Chloroflexota bacterium]|nr:alpha/beta hydrolase [Chloroflexota bacterium]MDE2941576.1 alpha/beta hydrolase [Chloroflexota bacterium]MDE3268057.1 alpha/beta hydrolase [Chloroflexota bacterium]
MSKAEKLWEVPEPLSTHDVRLDDEAVVTLRRHGNPEGPRLVMSHGNGLAIDLYYPFWSLLSDDFDLVLYDMRNHGWNDVGSIRNHNVPTLVSDHDRIVGEIDRHFGVKPRIGVFHSVSGLISLLSPDLGSGYSALFLLDPPIYRAGDSHSHEMFEAALYRAAAMTRRRTYEFKSRAEYADFLPHLSAFQRVLPGVCELFAETTLREDASGKGYELRCPREYEAKIMDYARVFAVAVDFESFKCPVKVLGADPTLPHSFLPAMDLSGMYGVDYDFLPDATHLLHLERPRECVDEIREFIQRVTGN